MYALSYITNFDYVTDIPLIGIAFSATMFFFLHFQSGKRKMQRRGFFFLLRFACETVSLLPSEYNYDISDAINENVGVFFCYSFLLETTSSFKLLHHIKRNAIQMFTKVTEIFFVFVDWMLR